jgi:hypothetical protein
MSQRAADDRRGDPRPDSGLFTKFPWRCWKRVQSLVQVPIGQSFLLCGLALEITGSELWVPDLPGPVNFIVRSTHTGGFNEGRPCFERRSCWPELSKFRFTRTVRDVAAAFGGGSTRRRRRRAVRGCPVRGGDDLRADGEADDRCGGSLGGRLSRLLHRDLGVGEPHWAIHGLQCVSYPQRSVRHFVC